jgi:phospholipid/cholesterol/gamma-HCH transport system substrate-binding protein
LGLLVAGILALFGIGLFAIGDRQRLWQHPVYVTVQMSSAGGVDVGTRVRVRGVNAGQVERVELPLSLAMPGPAQAESAPGTVLIRLRLAPEFLPLLAADATAEVVSEGLLGSKVIEVHPGHLERGPLVEGTVIPGRVDNLMQDLRLLTQQTQTVMTEVLGIAKQTRHVADHADRLLDDLQQLSKSTSAALAAAQTLLQDVREGQGPVGKELVGTLRQLQDASMALTQSLEGLRNLPILGRYWDNPAAAHAARLLVRPNYLRQVLTLREEELFPPGQALFLPEGLRRLDAWATQELPRYPTKGSEIVIVAYNGTATDPRAAEVLTLRQAEAVRTYLIDQHKIDRLGWFATRPVYALGMGTRPPPGEPPVVAPPPARVEIVVFIAPGG